MTTKKKPTAEQISLSRTAVLPAWNFKDIANTGFQGYLKTSYRELTNLLGAPTRTGSGDNKIQVEWVLRVGNTVATIYDYKGDCPLNDKEARWHIGGKDKLAVDMVAALTGLETILGFEFLTHHKRGA